MNESKLLFSSLFNAAVAAADPYLAVAPYLPPRPKGRTVVVGAGKGVSQLAAALEEQWDGILSGIVVTRYGFAVPCRYIDVREAGHPVPDANGLKASRDILDCVRDLGEDDLVIALVTGGGSALLPAPPPGVSLEDEIALNKALLASGAPISAMNAVRKQVSLIKGGRLALAAWPAKVVTLVVSDIPGDALPAVASGPTLPDEADKDAALKAISDYKMQLPANVLAYLDKPDCAAPRPSDQRFARNEYHMIASARKSLEAAAAISRKQGLATSILSDAIEGEARMVATAQAGLVRQIKTRNRPYARPVMLLSGGETTVTMKGSGRGGRNTEFLLSLALELEELPGVEAFSADTDGIDGTEESAGAFIDESTLSRMRDLDLDPKSALANNDSWTVFNALGDLFSTGPTGTNVNDFRAIFVR
ncbi:glycerate kinase [Ensifer sp. SSB1]|uniref:glycerate kinase type-2 family protein n=1 Tax=Ensifer sp. SSB1 TaxID=2795385 RepID=UPI001A4611F0|nr:glycerate kinase [Ensifer sp. SSB1]MBK5570626.1 glycerate kinase [Ensifer sp. SSB1]